MDSRKHILNFDRDELTTELVQTLQVKPFRAKQVVQWLYKRRVRDFSDMTDINKELREKLTANYQIYRPEIDTVQLSKVGTSANKVAYARAEALEKQSSQ